MSVVPTININEDQELFMHYGYKILDFPQDFPWYWEMKNQLERSERLGDLAKSKKTKKKPHEEL